MKTKVMVVFGGVYSSLGKGIVASSIARILTELGNKVSMMKFDPYLNVDPGTLSPLQHGEVFVTQDGGETDLDLGSYERFLGRKITKLSTVTSGRIYKEIIEKERAGGFNGKTVQTIPHVTDQIKSKIYNIIKAEMPDFLIIEVGGTVGDIESIPFVEALGQFRGEYGRDDVLFILCSPLIKVVTSGELKTKPTQHAVKTIGNMGVVPAMLVMRSDVTIDKSTIDKVAMLCHIPVQNIFKSLNLPSVYYLPTELYKQGIHQAIYHYFGLELKSKQNINKWNRYVNRIKNIKNKIKIAMVGKYNDLHDSYYSLVESLKLAAWEYKKNIKIEWINSEDLEKSNANIKNIFRGCHGILVPGGFGSRGIDGKLNAIRYARENKIPYLGICYGMQTATIEFARNVLGLENANTTEIDPNVEHKLFHYIDGRMRLGEQQCVITDKNSLAYKLYKVDMVGERHRHRWEFNNSYIPLFEKAGFKFTAFSNDKEKTVEMAEISNHPFFFGVQFHPEFNSWPGNPDPVFMGFVGAAIKHEKHKL
ncbi:MAG: CTP synthase [Mycoplasmataceae bacterium]|nr:CTP synthase [Mycoplasmataceae bacterium]